MEESKKLDKKKVIEFLQKKHAENLDTSPEKARPFAEAIGKLSGWDENEELPTELQAVLDKLVIDQGRFTRSNQEVPTQPEFYIPKVVEASQKRLRLADLETDAFTEMPAAPPTPADDSAGAASPSESAAPSEPSLPDMMQPLFASWQTTWPGEAREGVVFPGRLAGYLLIKNLGAGKYGQVWKARVLDAKGALQGVEEVALKFMNPNLTAEEKRSFRSELLVLRVLANYEHEHDLCQDGYSLVPYLYETKDETEAAPFPEFFTEALAQGTPLDALRSQQGAQPEAVAVQIIEQLCRVLEALHQGVRRSYLDFQPRNVFWNNKTGRIMVIDWNLLSTEARIDPAADIRSATQELYRLLMGVTPPAPGSRRALAEPRAAWDKLSRGAQDILAKAFHPTQAYPSVVELRQTLEILVHAWKLSPQELYSELQQRQSGLPNAANHISWEDFEILRPYAWAVDILDKRSALAADGSLKYEISRLRREVEGWISGKVWIERGRGFFIEAGSLESARECLDRAREDVQTELEAVRWLQAVEGARQKEGLIGKNIQPLDKNKVEQAMAHLSQAHYAEAMPLFEEMAAQPGREAYQALAAEAGIWKNLGQAPGFEASRQYAKLADCYTIAISLLKKLPADYRALVALSAGDLQSSLDRAARLDQETSMVDKFLQPVQAASLEKDFTEIYEILLEGLNEHPNQPALLAETVKMARQYLNRGEYDRGRALAALAVDHSLGASRESALEVWKPADALAKAWQAWRRRDLIGLETHTKDLQMLEGGRVYSPVFLNDLIKKATALPGDYFLAKFLLGLSNILQLNSAEDAAFLAARSQVEKLGQSLQEKLSADFQTSTTAGLERLSGYLDRYPGDQALLEWSRSYAENAIKEQKFQPALRVAELAGKKNAAGSLQRQDAAVQNLIERLGELTQASHKLSAVQAAWGEDHLPEAIQAARPWSPGNWSEEEKHLLRSLFNTWFDQARQAGDYTRARKLFSCIPDSDAAYSEFQSRLKAVLDQFETRLGEMLSKDFARGLGQLRELIAANPGDALLAHLVTRKMEAYLDQKDGYESASAVAGLVELFPQPPTRMRIVAEISQLCLHSLTAAPLERVPVYQRIQQLESQLS